MKIMKITQITKHSSNANASPAEHILCFDKWAKLIKSLKTHTPQQSVSKPTNVQSQSQSQRRRLTCAQKLTCS